MDAHQLVVDFLNTVDVETGTDLLGDARTWERWCSGHQLGAGDRAQAALLRDGLRTVVAGGTWSAPGVLTVPVSAQPDGVMVYGRHAAEAVLTAAVSLTATGSWSRLKLCPADDCRQAFYDRSHNRSRVWCEMADCGNRAKVRRYRARHPTTGPSDPSPEAGRPETV